VDERQAVCQKNLDIAEEKGKHFTEEVAGGSGRMESANSLSRNGVMGLARHKFFAVGIRVATHTPHRTEQAQFTQSVALFSDNP
jgi:hypothetical protein